MKVKWGWVLGIGCGAAILLVLVAIAAIAFFLGHVARDPQGIAVSVASPTEVAVGQNFDLTVTITNQRPRQAFGLSDIDVSEEYLAGFTIGEVVPKAKSNTHIPFDNSRSYTFDLRIPAGQARRFTFTLRAQKEGLYRGDVDVCEGARFVTEMAQTFVKPVSEAQDPDLKK
jgi:nitrogen fixation protein FixH